MHADEKECKARFRGSCISLCCLALMLIPAIGVRLSHITKENLWLDEFSTLYLATARGDFIYQMPHNVVIESPPYVGFSGSPAWWHIWNGVDSTTHPPLYHIVLRWWVDLFGEGDFAIRLMSTFFSVACIVLLYVAVNQTGGRWQALAAAGMMAFAPIQTFFSQEARPYTLLQCCALVAIIALISIQKKGRSPLKLAVLTISLFLLTLTHYFALGAIGAMALYAVIRFRGRDRIAVIACIVMALVIFAVAWGPKLTAYVQSGLADRYAKYPGRSALRGTLNVPERMTLHANFDAFFQDDRGAWYLVVSLAILCYVIPIFRLRKFPYSLFWWLWIVGAVGLVAALDVYRQSVLITIPRYTILAAPAIYAILAMPLPTKIGKFSPAIFMLATMVFAMSYWQTGQFPTPALQEMADSLRQDVKPGDAVILTGNYYDIQDLEPALDYYVLEHYGMVWKTPIVLATDRLNAKTENELRGFHRVWVFGYSPQSDTSRMLPSWSIHDIHGSANGNLIWWVAPEKL